jgi:amino acid transporter
MTTTRNTPTTQTAPAGAATRLAPKLTLVGVVLFGLAYMSPPVVLSTFGVIAAASKGAAPTAYIIGTIAMLLTALSYGKMARILPLSGSAYTYARRMIDSRVGFLVGWAILLDYFFLPMVAWLIQSLYLNAQFPGIPVWGWLLLNIVPTTIVNALGIVLADRVNRVFMAVTIAAMIVFVAFCVIYLGGASSPAPAGQALWNPATSALAVSAGAAIAAYSFLGFDAVSTLSEETHDAGRNIPRAILLTVLIGGAIFVVVSYVMQLVHPGGTFANESTAAFSMYQLVTGKTFANILNLVLIIGSFTCGLAIQASTSRLLFVMGRDGVLPRRFFGYLHPRLKTPLLNLLLVGAASMFAVNLSLDTAASFINFGAFLAFAMVNVSVIGYFIRTRKKEGRGRVFAFVVLPAIGALVDLYLLTQLSTIAIILGLSWLALGVIYLAVLTKGFRKAPPEMRFEPTEEGASREAVTS